MVSLAGCVCVWLRAVVARLPPTRVLLSLAAPVCLLPLLLSPVLLPLSLPFSLTHLSCLIREWSAMSAIFARQRERERESVRANGTARRARHQDSGSGASTFHELQVSKETEKKKKKRRERAKRGSRRRLELSHSPPSLAQQTQNSRREREGEQARRLGRRSGESVQESGGASHSASGLQHRLPVSPSHPSPSHSFTLPASLRRAN